MASKRTHQFASYQFSSTANTNNPSSPAAFSPAPETPNSGFFSPLNPTNSLILPPTNNNQRRKSKQPQQLQQQQQQQASNKRRKSSNVNQDDLHLPSPNNSLFLHTNHVHQPPENSKDDHPDLDPDPEDDEARKELNDDDYSVRKREDLINKDKLKILLEHFDPQQMDRYTEYRNSGLAKANVRKLANTILQQSVSERVTIVIRGLAKVFVGHIVEQALEVQKRRGGSGGLTPYDLKQAYQIYLNERDRGGSDRRKLFIK